MAWSFNGLGNNGLTALLPGNSLMVGSAATGNALRTTVGDLETKSVEIRPPGGDYAFRRVTGLLPRKVEWQWQIAATVGGLGTPAVYLSTIEAAIEAYLKDGREYVLSDGERSGSAIVRRATRVGRRALAIGPKYLQLWRLEFVVMQPAIGATYL